MIYSVVDSWSSDRGRLKIRSNRHAEVKISVHWNVLGRTVASRRGSSPTFRGRLHLHLQYAADGLVEQAISLVEQDISLVEQVISFFYRAISSTLKMETESVSETSKNFHILTRLSAGERFIKFCRRESFKTDKVISFVTFVSPCIISIIAIGNKEDATILIYLLLISSTCFGRWFRPSSRAYICNYSLWYCPQRWTIPEAVVIALCSRWWAKLSPETCRSD